MHGKSRTPLPDGARGNVTQRNIWWTMLFARLLMKDERLRHEFPQGIDVVLLPEGDDELVQHNLSMFHAMRGKQPVVLVDIAIHDSTVDIRPMEMTSRPARRLAIA